MSSIRNIVLSIVGVGFLATGAAAVSENISITTKTEEQEEIINYDIETEYDDSKRSGTVEVKQEGKNGRKKVKYEVKYKRNTVIERNKISEEVIEDQQPKILIEGTKIYYACSNGNEYETLTEKEECEKRVAWEKIRDQSLAECNADANKTNCWFDEYPGTKIHYIVVAAPRPAPSYRGNTNSGVRTGAICRDGWRSSATGRGACSHHGGVSQWI